MSFRNRSSTTRLPQSLLEEINAQEARPGHSNAGRKRNAGVSSRKATRKEERLLAKQRKIQFFSHAAERQSNKRLADVGPQDAHLPRKKTKLQSSFEASEPQAQRPIPPRERKRTDDKEHNEGSSKTKERKSKSVLEKKTEDADVLLKENKSKGEKEEDAYMAMLEKNLGIRKDKKGKGRYGIGFEDDGLLDLLVDLDEKMPDSEESNMAEDLSDLEEASKDSEFDDSESSVSGDSDEGSEGGAWVGFPLEGSSEDDEKKLGVDSAGDEGSSDTEENGQNTASKYLPPHLRRQQDKQLQDISKVDAKLARSLKGLLNRLGEQNMESILNEIEGLYRSHSRHDITTTLTSHIVEGTCSHSILLDSYVALHAGLVACLHRIIGVDLAAYFVQNVVALFEHHYTNSKGPADDDDTATPSDGDLGKECSNLLVLLSDLYNYHVISCTLMYDIIRLILEGDLSELDVELILKVARGSGAQLRQDDPSALKDIIQIVQSKIGDQRNISSRTRFMVETLNNLKNNKIKKTTAGAHGVGESKDRISKFVANIGTKHHVHAHEPLRISLDDLHQAESKGKWWLVGAAWGGDPLVDRQTVQAPVLARIEATEIDDTLLKLARKQGMNTDVRRSIFVVLMSSDDYVDAGHRLAQLNLTEVQQREIIRVLLHCCGNEKSYNPYYTLIAQHLCRQTHSHRVTLQYCFWDFLRSLGETNVGGADIAANHNGDEDDEEGFELDRVSSTRIANVARLYAWLVAKDCLAITILKTLDFLVLKTKTKTFLRLFFTHLFSNVQDPSAVPTLKSSADASILARRDEKPLADLILKATRVPALALGISHFLTMTFSAADSHDPSDAFVQWCCEVVKDVLQGAIGDL